QAASTNLPFLVFAEKRVFLGLALVGGCFALSLTLGSVQTSLTLLSLNRSSRAKALIHWRAFPHVRQCSNKFGIALT
ncbi:MAG: hypothetical protein ACI308_05235, partial [Muribaculaceae bacterium]